MLVACGGGGGGASTTAAPTSPTPTAAVPPTAGVAAEPTTFEWTELTGQLAASANNALQAALGGSATTSMSRWAPAILRMPAATAAVSSAYFCCGALPVDAAASANSYVTVDSTLTVIAGASSFGLVQDLKSLATTTWVSNNGTRWRLEMSNVRVTGNVDTSGGNVRPEQRFRLQGTLIYYLPSGEEKRAEIDVALVYRDVESGEPAATGQAGPAPLAGDALKPLIPPQRCSRPREGCGPLVMGDAACNGFPVCAR